MGAATPALQINVEQYQSDSAALAAIVTAHVLTVSDTAEDIVADAAQLSADASVDALKVVDAIGDVESNFDALASLGKLTTITLTDPGAEPLQLTVAQFLNDQALLAKIGAPYQLVISDTAANIENNLAALAAKASAIGAIYTSDGAPVIVSPNQVMTDAAALNAVAGGYFVQGDAASVLNNLAAIAAQGSQIALTLVSGAPVAATVAQWTPNQSALDSIAGAAFASYEVDLDANNAVSATKLFFNNVGGQTGLDQEYDFNASSQLTRLLATGVTGQSYSAFEMDYSNGAFAGAVYTMASTPAGAQGCSVL